MAPQEAPMALQEAPMALQEAPMALQEAPMALQEAPMALQEAPICSPRGRGVARPRLLGKNGVWWLSCRFQIVVVVVLQESQTRRGGAVRDPFFLA